MYQFDFKSKSLIETPFLTINHSLLRDNYGIEQFMPSGFAIHPVTCEFYIISSVGKHLIAMNRNNEIEYAEKMVHKFFSQPEGICFSKEGKTLYISNEGKEKLANILIFKSI